MNPNFVFAAIDSRPQPSQKPSAPKASLSSIARRLSISIVATPGKAIDKVERNVKHLKDIVDTRYQASLDHTQKHRKEPLEKISKPSLPSLRTTPASDGSSHRFIGSVVPNFVKLHDHKSFRSLTSPTPVPSAPEFLGKGLFSNLPQTQPIPEELPPQRFTVRGSLNRAKTTRRSVTSSISIISLSESFGTRRSSNLAQPQSITKDLEDVHEFKSHTVMGEAFGHFTYPVPCEPIQTLQMSPNPSISISSLSSRDFVPSEIGSSSLVDSNVAHRTLYQPRSQSVDMHKSSVILTSDLPTFSSSIQKTRRVTHQPFQYTASGVRRVRLVRSPCGWRPHTSQGMLESMSSKDLNQRRASRMSMKSTTSLTDWRDDIMSEYEEDPESSSSPDLDRRDHSTQDLDAVDTTISEMEYLNIDQPNSADSYGLHALFGDW